LFADVELASGDEAAGLEAIGMEIEDADGDEGGLLLQPCGALKQQRCSIYTHRPECCRTFECRLLKEVEHGAVGVGQAKGKIAEALRRIERVKELIVQLGSVEECLPLQERCVEALAFSEATANPALKQKRAELQAVMRSVERLIQAMFFGG
jgi:Fe-S-cluster containining protein